MPTLKNRLETLERHPPRKKPLNFSHMTDAELVALLDARQAPDVIAAAADLVGVAAEHLAGRIMAGN